MHVPLCDVLVNSVIGNKDRVVGSVRGWLSVYGLHIVTDIRKQCGTALNKILVGETKCRECRLQLRIVRSGSLRRVRKSDDRRTGGGGVRGGVRWRALLRRCDLRSRDGLAGLGSSASKHQKEKGPEPKGLDQEDPDRHGPSHSGTARSRFSHTPQHLCPSRGNPVITGIVIDRVTRSRLKRAERRIKLCSESGYSKRWLGQITFRDSQERQLNIETTAMAFLAGNADFSAMRGADGLHYGKAQSRPAGVARACLIRPVEALEDVRKGVGRYPSAIVRDLEDRCTPVSANTHFDFAAFLCVFDGIGDKVHDNLLKARSIPLDEDTGRHIAAQQDRLLLSQEPHLFRSRRRQMAEVQSCLVHFYLTCVQARYDQQVLDDVRHPMRFFQGAANLIG